MNSPFRTILVQLDLGEACAIRVSLAAAIAQAFDAHLVGLHTAPPADVPIGLAGVLGESIAKARDAAIIRLAEHSAERFERLVRAAGLASRSEFRVAGDDPVDATIRHARYADLVVIGQPEQPTPDGVFTGQAYADRVLLLAARPVLVVPTTGRNRATGERIMVAWSARREAARAVSDALPFLQRAQAVTLVAFNPIASGGHGEVPGADVGAFLARHDVRVDVQSHGETENDMLDIGTLISRRAVTLDADLVVMGAYGHSRWRELVLGGATRSMLERATLPVLFSH